MHFAFVILSCLFTTDSLTTDSLLHADLSPLVITSHRTPNPMLQSFYSISVLTKEQMGSQLARSTPEALSGLPGVFIQKTNHGGGSAILRGLTGNQTLMLIDGIRLNNSTYRYGPNQYLNTIDPFSIEQVEVLKGAGSVQYGSDALGGTIQLFTPTVSLNRGFVGHMILRGTTQGMDKTAHAELGYGSKSWSANASVGLRDFGDLFGGKGIGQQTPSGYNEEMANFKLFKQLGHHSFTASHQYFNAHHVPVYHKVVLENFKINEMSIQKRNLSILKHQYTSNSNFFHEINTQVALHQTVEERLSQKNGTTKSQVENDQVHTFHLGTQINSFFYTHWKGTTGFEFYGDQIKSYKTISENSSIPNQTKLRGLYPDNALYNSFSLYSIQTFDYKKIILNAGLRYNSNQIKLEEETLGAVKLNPSAFIYHTNLGYLINKHQSTYISYNTGFKAPNIDDMGTLGIVDFRYELPATDLKPEKSSSMELGYKLYADKSQLQISVYQTKISNLITRIRVPDQVISGYPVYTKSNIDQSVIRGFELDANTYLFKNFSVYGQMAFTYGKNKLTAEPLRRIPPLFGRIHFNYLYRRFTVRPEIAFAGAQTRLAKGDIDDNRIGPNGTAGWSVFNVYLSYTSKKIQINTSLQNLTNEAYKYHGSGIYAQGCSATLQIQYFF